MGKKTKGMRLVIGGRSEMGAVREGSTGRVVAVLPKVWAVGEAGPQELKPLALCKRDGRAEGRPSQTDASPKQIVEVAFYRKYTEAMVRRYSKMSMEAGRAPSLLGRELFRGKVTSYKVQSFDDVVIFCADMEACMLKLNQNEQNLVKRIALQEYTYDEASGLLGLSLGNCIRQYRRAVDRLTGILVEAKLLRPEILCQ